MPPFCQYPASISATRHLVIAHNDCSTLVCFWNARQLTVCSVFLPNPERMLPCAQFQGAPDWGTHRAGPATGPSLWTCDLRTGATTPVLRLQQSVGSCAKPRRIRQGFRWPWLTGSEPIQSGRHPKPTDPTTNKPTEQKMSSLASPEPAFSSFSGPLCLDPRVRAKSRLWPVTPRRRSTFSPLRPDLEKTGDLSACSRIAEAVGVFADRRVGREPRQIRSPLAILWTNTRLLKKFSTAC